MRTAAILPVKRFSAAKQRLGERVADSFRAELARAMVGDVLSALRECPAIDITIVVTCEPSVAAAARCTGASVVEDTAQDGQSAAVTIGLEHALREGVERALCIPGDCPTLDPAELDALLALPSQIEKHAGAPENDGDAAPDGHRAEVVIVPDRHGSGTNGLLLTPPDAIDPSFGPGSRVRHEQLARSAGVACRIEHLPSLLLDIDTGDDLAALRERLAGEAVRAARTRAVLDRRGPQDGHASDPGHGISQAA